MNNTEHNPQNFDRRLADLLHANLIRQNELVTYTAVNLPLIRLLTVDEVQHFLDFPKDLARYDVYGFHNDNRLFYRETQYLEEHRSYLTTAWPDSIVPKKTMHERAEKWVVVGADLEEGTLIIHVGSEDVNGTIVGESLQAWHDRTR
jgi:hypothetical protein